MERAFVVTIGDHRQAQISQTRYQVLDSLSEIDLLVQSAGSEVVGHRHLRRIRSTANGIPGPRIIHQIASEARNCYADLVVFDCELTDRQAYRVQHSLGSDLSVLDRTQLILHIFAKHANSREGQLQAAEAQIAYRLATIRDLFRTIQKRRTGRSHGRGPMHGDLNPIDAARFNLARDLKRIESQLANIRIKRRQRRRRRQSQGLETIALVGYTNTGKSTLFNSLTASTVATSDRVFETVDPTIRTIRLPSKREALLVDTVGFIADTPTILLSGFAASLEEVRAASLILRVSDVSDPQSQVHEAHVDRILDGLEVSGTPQLRVLNKTDLISHARLAELEMADSISTSYVSARLSTGLNDLLERIDFGLNRDPLTRLRVRLPYSEVRVALEVLSKARIFSAEYHDADAEYDLQVTASFAVRLNPFVTSIEPA